MAIVLFTAKQAARDLWDFGEDDLIDIALNLDDKTLGHLHYKVQRYMKKDMLAYLGRKIDGYDLGLFTALTIVAHFEGKVRRLKRNRKRNKANLPV